MVPSTGHLPKVTLRYSRDTVGSTKLVARQIWTRNLCHAVKMSSINDGYCRNEPFINGHSPLSSIEYQFNGNSISYVGSLKTFKHHYV